MTSFHFLFIITCFLVMAIIWVATAFSTKRVVKKSGGWTLRFIFYATIALFVYLQKNIDFLTISLWPKTVATYVIADIVTSAGLLVMLWARITLGKNWSANIVIKENHELITSGPYAYVRHPIYSGLILMVLGVVLYVNTLGWLVFFIIFFFGAYYKARKEEKLLIDNFTDAYLEYKKHTKILIPFLF
jgi:protein-S-isoprenylcysteine O-methyltransferase Ste14